MKQVRRGQNVMPNSRYLTRKSLTANVTAKHYRPSSILPQNNTYLSEFYRATSADLPEFYRKTSADLPDFYRKPFRPLWILTQNVTRLVIYLLYYISLFPSFTQHLAKWWIFPIPGWYKQTFPSSSLLKFRIDTRHYRCVIYFTCLTLTYVLCKSTFYFFYHAFIVPPTHPVVFNYTYTTFVSYSRCNVDFDWTTRFAHV